jgi:hypothetical protein
MLPLFDVTASNICKKHGNICTRISRELPVLLLRIRHPTTRNSRLDDHGAMAQKLPSREGYPQLWLLISITVLIPDGDGWQPDSHCHLKQDMSTCKDSCISFDHTSKAQQEVVHNVGQHLISRDSIQSTNLTAATCLVPRTRFTLPKLRFALFLF